MPSVKKVGVKAVGEQCRRQNGLLSVFLQWYRCMCQASYHTATQTSTNMTRPFQAQIGLCSQQSNQRINQRFNIHFKLCKTHEGKVIKTSMETCFKLNI